MALGEHVMALTPMQHLQVVQGMPATGKNVRPYELDPGFERALAYYFVTDGDVYARLAEYLDPKLMPTKEAQLACRAALDVGTARGMPPKSETLVLQQLVAQRNAGKVTQEQINDVADYLTEAVSSSLPKPEMVAQSMAELLSRHLIFSEVGSLSGTLAARKDPRKTLRQIERLVELTEQNASASVEATEDGFDEIVAAGMAAKLPTGCAELDDLLGGGMPIGCTMLVGPAKAGKSMVLSSLAAEGYYRGLNVLYATLELSSEFQLARVYANLFNVPTDELEAGRNTVARQRFRALREMHNDQGLKPNCSIRWFDPGTPVKSLLEWVDSTVEKSGRKVDLLLVDYVDLVGGAGGKSDESDYQSQKVVVTALRSHAVKHGYVVATASQAKRGINTLKLDVDDAADSQHKVRVADVVISLRMEQDRKDYVDYFISAGRKGQDRKGTGELPVDRSYARMFPTNRSLPW